MPRRESTNKSARSAAVKEDVQYIVKGSSPVYATLCVLTFLLLVAAVTMQFLELQDFYGYEFMWSIIFPPK